MTIPTYNMKKDYFENLSDAESWRQQSGNNDLPTDDIEFLKYRLNQVGKTEDFDDERRQQPTLSLIHI